MVRNKQLSELLTSDDVKVTEIFTLIPDIRNIEALPDCLIRS